MFYTLSEVTGIGIAISKKTKFSMLCSFIAMLFSVILNYFLVKDLGAKGAVISTATAFFIFLGMRTFISNIVWKKLHFNFSTIFLLYFLCLAHLLYFPKFSYFFFFWIVMLVIGFFIFNKQVNYIVDLLKRKFKGGVV